MKAGSNTSSLKEACLAESLDPHQGQVVPWTYSPPPFVKKVGGPWEGEAKGSLN